MTLVSVFFSHFSFVFYSFFSTLQHAYCFSNETAILEFIFFNQLSPSFCLFKTNANILKTVVKPVK